MLTRVDRIALAVPDRRAAAAGWTALLGAEPAGERRSACLAARCSRCASLFGLDAAAFVPIESKQYAYAGTLTLFDRERLGRFEVITPNDPANTMGRFFTRAGEAFYMAFAESAALAAIEERARERGDGFTAIPPDPSERRAADTIFLHPPALGGMMLGLSRPTLAWQWSGHPERVEAAL